MKCFVLIFMMSFAQVVYGISYRAPLKRVVTSVIACNSYQHSMRSLVLNLLFHENRSVCCALYGLTDNDIISGLARAHDRGVNVSVVVDKNSDVSLLRSLFKRDIILVFNGTHFSKMHNKFYVFGDDLVVTGSSNASNNAEEHNFENLIIVEDEDIALAYKKYFERMNQNMKQGNYDRK